MIEGVSEACRSADTVLCPVLTHNFNTFGPLLHPLNRDNDDKPVQSVWLC